MAGVVHIPWYAAPLRADAFADALAEIAAVAARYDATEYRVYRSRDDHYKFLQVAGFESKLDFTRYWEGREFVRWRALHAGWFQIAVLYAWHDVIAEGALELAPAVRDVADG